MIDGYVTDVEEHSSLICKQHDDRFIHSYSRYRTVLVLDYCRIPVQGIIRDNTFGYYTAIIRYNMQAKMPTSRIIGDNSATLTSQGRRDTVTRTSTRTRFIWDAYISRGLQICTVLY